MYLRGKDIGIAVLILRKVAFRSHFIAFFLDFVTGELSWIWGARCSFVVRAFAHGAIGRLIDH